MKKYLVLSILLILALSMLVVGCSETAEPSVKVSAIADYVEVTDIADYNYKSLFTITKDGTEITVVDEYLNKSELPTVPNTEGSIVCTYEGVSKTVTVKYKVDVVTVTASSGSIDVFESEFLSYDYTRLFTITVNGVAVTTLDSMLDKSLLPLGIGDVGKVTCSYGGQSAEVAIRLVNDVKITLKSESLNLTDEQLMDYDLTNEFRITVNGAYVRTKAEYIDLSQVPEDGEGKILCTYEHVTVELPVTVRKIIYVVELSTSDVEINIKRVSDYDFLTFFSATRDGEAIELTESDVSTDLRNEIGTYTYTVTVGKVKGVSKSLEIVVSDAHLIEIIPCYRDLVINVDELDSYDYTKLFMLYVDELAVAVDGEMIDLTETLTAQAGDTVTVTLTYSQDDTTESGSISFLVGEIEEINITAKNVVIYPNSGAIDMTTLFKITQGDEEITVTANMISGSIDYLSEGDNFVTLTYGGKSATATVSIKRGVVIDYVRGDTVTVSVGSDKEKYNFGADFSVVINGERFTNISSYVDTADVDFSTLGEYTTEISIPYNVNTFGLSGPKFEYYKKPITYVVVPSSYALTVFEDYIFVEDKSIDITNDILIPNINLRINGYNQSLTTNKNWVNAITCYFEYVRTVDVNEVGVQELVIDLYVNGLDYDPIEVSFSVEFDSEITIKSSDVVLYVGDTVYLTDLFEIDRAGEKVKVENSMLSGHVDVFTPGVYEVDIDYLGVRATSSVVVYSNSIKGKYVTNMTTIPKESSEDEEGYETEAGATAKRIGDLTINSDGSITFEKYKVEVLSCIDENTMFISIGSTNYMMYSNEGVLVLNPDNSYKLSFIDGRRPLVFFNEDIWTLNRRIEINQYSTHVLQNKSACYSMDCFDVTNKESGDNFIYVLKTHLVDKTSADTVYDVTFGFGTFAEGFEPVAGNSSALTFDGMEYEFTMSDSTKGRIDVEENNNLLLKNSNFVGTVDGVEHRVSIDSYGNYTIIHDGVEIARIGNSEMTNQNKYGGFDVETNVLSLFSSGVHENEFFSYQYLLDLDTHTFAIIKGDGYKGTYEYEKMYLFLDGYGRGLVNYNTDSGYIYKIAYEVNGGELEITYLDYKVGFSYGKKAKFLIAPLGNVLTVKEFTGAEIVGEQFVNRFVTEGAIVTVSKFVYGASSTSKNELLSNITILTSEGYLDSSIEGVIDTKTVSFTKEGFYQFTVSPFGSDGAKMYFSVQILDDILKDTDFVGNYSDSSGKFKLNIDKYGQLTVTCDGQYFDGFVTVRSDGGFVGTAKGDIGAVSVSGTLIEKGLAKISATGAIHFSDYFAVGATVVAGTDGVVLKKYMYNGKEVYFYSTVSGVAGEQVELTLVKGTTVDVGSVVSFSVGGKNFTVKIKQWGDEKRGLELADNVMGSYTNDLGETLVLDGYGVAVLKGTTCSYVANANGSVTVTLNGSVYFFDLDGDTYTTSSMVIDNSILEGANLGCYFLSGEGEDGYMVTTTFTFKKNGEVTVKSYSDDYDSYQSIYGSAEGVEGLYSVNKNTVTITVNGYAFTLLIKDVSLGSSLSLLSSTLPEGCDGYIPVGTNFGRV